MTVLEDIRKLQETVDSLRERAVANAKKIDRHEEQISGERGLSAAINELSVEVRGLRKAAYWLAGLIVTASISFGFSVLVLIPPG